jgi:PCI domain
LILRYLIPAQILRGFLPSKDLLDQNKSLNVYAVLKDALQQGNLFLFDETFNENQTLLIKWGTWLVVERCRLLVVRTLFKKIWEIMDKPSRLSLEVLQKGLQLSTRNESVTVDEVSCLVVNLIDKSYMKGYISFEKQVIVLSNTKAFPALKT